MSGVTVMEYTLLQVGSVVIRAVTTITVAVIVWATLFKKA